MSDPSSLTVAELRKELEEQGLPSDGLKAVLVKRLKEHQGSKKRKTTDEDEKPAKKTKKAKEEEEEEEEEDEKPTRGRGRPKKAAAPKEKKGGKKAAAKKTTKKDEEEESEEEEEEKKEVKAKKGAKKAATKKTTKKDEEEDDEEEEEEKEKVKEPKKGKKAAAAKKATKEEDDEEEDAKDKKKGGKKAAAKKTTKKAAKDEDDDEEEEEKDEKKGNGKKEEAKEAEKDEKEEEEKEETKKTDKKGKGKAKSEDEKEEDREKTKDAAEKATDMSSGEWKWKDTMIYYEMQGVKPSEKLACFDYDGCLAKTSLFARGADDWSVRHPSVPKRLKELHEKGYKLVIMSNQADIGRAKPENQPTVIATKASRLLGLAKAVGLPFQILVATAGSKDDDDYRKPAVGMWTFAAANNGGVTVDKDKCFFVGDAAGRKASKGKPKDHGDTDKGFAKAAGLRFFTEDEFFENGAKFE